MRRVEPFKTFRDVDIRRAWAGDEACDGSVSAAYQASRFRTLDRRGHRPRRFAGSNDEQRSIGDVMKDTARER